MNPLAFYTERPSICDDTGYELATTYWGDYRVAIELGGEQGVKETFENSMELAKHDKIYGTELSMVLNWLMFYYHDLGGKENIKKSLVFEKYWIKWHNWVIHHWKGEDLTYYLRTVD